MSPRRRICTSPRVSCVFAAALGRGSVRLALRGLPERVSGDGHGVGQGARRPSCGSHAMTPYSLQPFIGFSPPGVGGVGSLAGESECHGHSKYSFRIRGQADWHGNCSSLVQLGCVRAPDQRNSEVGQATFDPVVTGWCHLRQAFRRTQLERIGRCHRLHGNLPVWRDRLICRCKVAPRGEGDIAGVRSRRRRHRGRCRAGRAGRSPAVQVPDTCRAESWWAHAVFMD